MGFFVDSIKYRLQLFILFVCRHMTSGMGLEPDASGAARVCIELGVRTVRTAFINTNASDLSGRRGDRNPRLESS